jgi:hypothetical protein
MRTRKRRRSWAVPIFSLTVGIIALFVHSSAYHQRIDAQKRLAHWPRAQAVVTQSQTLPHADNKGRTFYTHRAVVHFDGVDHRPREGVVLGKSLGEGETLAVYYDPALQYAVDGATDAKRVYSEQENHEGLSDRTFWTSVIAACAGIPLVLYGLVMLVISMRRKPDRSAT